MLYEFVVSVKYTIPVYAHDFATSWSFFFYVGDFSRVPLAPLVLHTESRVQSHVVIEHTHSLLTLYWFGTYYMEKQNKLCRKLF